VFAFMTSEFLSHLEELRRRLLMCFLAFLVASGGAFFYSSELIDVLILPFRRPTATQLFFQKPANDDVLLEKLPEVLFSQPPRSPARDVAETHCRWMCFLSHSSSNLVAGCWSLVAGNCFSLATSD